MPTPEIDNTITNLRRHAEATTVLGAGSQPPEPNLFWMRTAMDHTGDKRFEAALALLEERRFVEAINAFSELVALAPDMTGAYGNRGLAYLNLGLDDAAKSDFETVIQLDPGDAMGHSMLAEIARFHGNHEEALDHVNAALELNPDEPQAYFIRGWLFAHAGQFEMAAMDLLQHLELAGDRENSDVSDFHSACQTLAEDDPRDDCGDPIDTPEKTDEFLGLHGWSFNQRENTDFELQGLPCPFAHCIRNRPPLSPETGEGCPVFGYSCPGGEEQVHWCSEHPPILD